MRFGLVSRNNLTLVLLFALAFGGAFVYMSARSPDPSAPIASAVAQDVDPPHHGAAPSSAPDNAAPAPIADGEAAAQTAQAAPEAAPKLSEQETQNLTRWSNQVVSSHTPETRASAIRELATVKHQESVRALAQALISDEEPANRVLAIEALNSLASSGYETVTIRNTLRLAAADTDQDVADHAKEAYDELMRADESK